MSDIKEKWMPVFKKGDDEFVITNLAFVGDTEKQAEEIALGVQYGECIMWNFEYTGRVIQVKDIKGYKGTLGNIPIMKLAEAPT